MSTNAKKILEKAPEKAIREPRAKKLKVDMKSLPDAVVDGTLVVKKGCRVFFERTLNKRTAIHVGTIFDVQDDIVTVSDETRGQFYVFSVKDPPNIKAASANDVVQRQEAPDGVKVDEEGRVGCTDDERSDAQEPAVGGERSTT